MSAIPKLKRLPLVLLGALVILLFVIFAIAEGLGHPSVPSGSVAVVEDAPAGLSPITRHQYDRALAQTAARSGVKDTPRPGSAQYEQLKQGAMNDLLDQVWIQGEAAELGITTNPNEVGSQLRQTISQNFRSKAEYDKFRRQSHFSPQEIRTRIKLQILSNKIQQQVVSALPPVTQSDVQAYYDDAKSSLFQQPASRDVRLILNKDKAKVEQAQAALQGDLSDANWKKVAAKYSTDPSSKSNGGLRPGLTQGLLEQPLDQQVFSAATGQLEGPVHTPLGWYVFEVEKVTPARTVPLNKSASDQIRSQLTQQAQQNAFSAFVEDFGSKWKSRTFCAENYLIDRCDNFKGGAHPSTAPAGCYEKHPKGGRPDACPAPVALLAPALPGSVSIISPQGNRLQQRPVPSGPAAPAAGLGGLSGAQPGAAPAGAAPTGAAP